MFTTLSARAKQGLKIVGIVLVLLILFLVWGMVRAGSRKRKRDQATDGLDATINALRSEIAATNAEAAIQIHAARTQDVALKQDLAEVIELDDGKARREQLIALRNRLK